MRTLLLLIAFLPAWAVGQHVITLPAQRLQPPAGIRIDSVYLSFDPLDAVGMVMKGLGNRPTAAFLVPDTRRALTTLLPTDAPTGGGTLGCGLRINVLQVSEVILGASEKAACALNFDLITRTDSGTVLLFEFGGTFRIRGGLDATGNHGEGILNALQAGLDAYATARVQGIAVPRVIRDAPTDAPTLQAAMGHAVSITGAPEKGIYRSFMDMRDQRPDTRATFTLKPVKNEPGRSLMVRMKEDDRADTATAWGFSDGRDIFMAVGGRFVRLEREGGQFMCRIAQTELVELGPAIAVGLMFGALGVGVYAVIGSTSAKGPIRSLDLDLATGSLLPVSKGAWRPLSSKQVLVHSKHSKAPAVQVQVPGRPLVNVPKNGYHVLELPCRLLPARVDLSIGTADPQGRMLTTFDLSTAQVHLLKADKDGGIELDLVNGNMANALLKDLDGMTRVP